MAMGRRNYHRSWWRYGTGRFGEEVPTVRDRHIQHPAASGCCWHLSGAGLRAGAAFRLARLIPVTLTPWGCQRASFGAVLASSWAACIRNPAIGHDRYWGIAVVLMA